MIETTVLIENALLFVAIGYAFNKTRKALLLTCLAVIFIHMLIDNILLSTLNIHTSSYDNMVYYWSMSFLFLAFFAVFLIRMTKTSLIFAGLMLAQSFMSFLIAINGASMNSVTLPEYDIVYSLHEIFNSVIWVVEVILVWTVATTNKK